MVRIMFSMITISIFICRLLDILAGRKDPSGLSGHVLIDGRPLPTNFKRISGYVVQAS